MIYKKNNTQQQLSKANQNSQLCSTKQQKTEHIYKLYSSLTQLSKMELKPKIGIDNLTFGLNKLEVIKILGEPNRVFEMEDDDNELTLEWNEKKLRLTFYKNENEKFGYLRTSNTKLTYNGHLIINSNSQFAKEEIFCELLEWEKEEYEFLTVYFNENYWLSLNCEYGKVIDIEMGVTFKDDENYDWPKITQ